MQEAGQFVVDWLEVEALDSSAVKMKVEGAKSCWNQDRGMSKQYAVALVPSR